MALYLEPGGAQPDRGRRWTHHQRLHLIRVRAMVRRAVELGDLPPLGACACGAPAAVYHHDDYDRPLDVTPFCRSCHVGWHRANGPGRLSVENPGDNDV